MPNSTPGHRMEPTTVRLMVVYESVTHAIAALDTEIRYQQAYRTAHADQMDEELHQAIEVTLNDAVHQMAVLMSLQDWAATIVGGIVGQHAFKTGETHRMYRQVLEQVAAGDTDPLF